MNKIIFSGIQPTGVIHIGNYLGAIKQWISLQHEAEKSIFCVVDLHAITVPQDPEKLKNNIYSVAALYLAAGIDPEKSSLFVQSSRPEHSQLAWLLNCNTQMGELGRMTQYKEKSEKKKDSVTVGLYGYPVLMAADILLYRATHVPVGEDQIQHVELARDVAQRFNHRFGETFVLPKALTKKTSARIMGLDNPLKKMSKSADSQYNYIALNDTPKDIENKIKKAVTDSGTEIKSGLDKPAITNLLNIFSEVTGKEICDLEKEFSGKGYGEFKNRLAEAIIEYIMPIQKKHAALMNDRAELSRILQKGSSNVSKVAHDVLNDVSKKMGIGL